MKLLLRINWAETIDFVEKSGYFVGRKKEIRHIKSTILNNESGSILVAGIRGVGKTSFVYKTIQELQKDFKDRKRKCLPVIISAAQLGYKSEGNTDTFYKKLIENLIRRLYSSCLQNKIKISNLDNLYKKIQGNYLKTHTIQELKLSKDTNKDSTTKKLKWTKKIDSEVITYFIKMLLAVIGTLFVVLPSELPYRILGVVLVLIPSCDISYLKEKIIEKIELSQRNKSAKEIYEEDNSISNLEFDLIKVLEENQKEHKFLFIIDELDKIKTDESNNFEIIKLYKNLFNLSKANFIFITDQKDYEELIESQKADSTLPTLFTHKYYLNLPNTEELFEYLELIIDSLVIDDKKFKLEQLDSSGKKKLLSFFHYLLYISKNDFFLLKNELNGLSDFDEKNNQIIDIDLAIKDEGKLDYRIKSNLQKALTQIYEIKRSNLLSNWHKNSQILSKLFGFVDQHYSVDGDFTSYKSDILIQDFVDYLVRLKAVEIEIPSGEPEKQTLIWTNDITDVPESPKHHFKTEFTFIKTFQLFMNNINEIDNLSEHYEDKKFGTYTKVYQSHDGQEFSGINAYNIYNKYKEQFQKLNDIPPKHVPEETLKASIDDLLAQINKLKTVSFQTLCNLFAKIINLKEIKLDKHTIQEKPDLISSLQSLKTEIGALKHTVFFNPELSKQVIIVENLVNYESNHDLLQNLYNQNKTYIIINLITDNDVMPPNKIKTTIDKITGTDKEGNDITESNEVTLNNIINVKLVDSYKIFAEPILKTLNWLK